MNRLEAKIRDCLAANLDMVEPGLVLVKTEFALANSAGAGGFIDILARDPLKHYVVIEIKRSDQTARAALHELTKYVALLKATLGIRPEQIRALLLSTEWRELAVPFAEYRRICEVPTDGYTLAVNSDGTVISVSAIVPTVIDQPLNLSRQQFVLLFRDSRDRDAALPSIANTAQQVHLKDFAILALDYHGGSQEVIFPHGLYIIFSPPLIGLSEENATIIKNSIPWVDDLDDLDENFLCALTEKIDIEYDDAEAGYPEKLELLFQTGWHLLRIQRHGRYAANASLLTDDQLVTEATKKEGGASHYLERTVSPRYAPSWTKFENDARLVLLGNASWEKIFFQIIDRTKNCYPTATISTHIYNPANILFSLTKLFGTGDPRYIPNFQLVITCADDVTLYVGRLCWDGHLVTLDGKDWIERAFESIDRWMLMSNFNEQWEEDDAASALIGLTSVVLEVKKPGSNVETTSVLSMRGEKIVSTLLAESPIHTISDFVSTNSNFGTSLVSAARAFSIGMAD